MPLFLRLLHRLKSYSIGLAVAKPWHYKYRVRLTVGAGSSSSSSAETGPQGACQPTFEHAVITGLVPR